MTAVKRKLQAEATLNVTFECAAALKKGNFIFTYIQIMINVLFMYINLLSIVSTRTALLEPLLLLYLLFLHLCIDNNIECLLCQNAIVITICHALHGKHGLCYSRPENPANLSAVPARDIANFYVRNPAGEKNMSRICEDGLSWKS